MKGTICPLSHSSLWKILLLSPHRLKKFMHVVFQSEEAQGYSLSHRVGWLGDYTAIPLSVGDEPDWLQIKQEDYICTVLHLAVWNMHDEAISVLLDEYPSLSNRANCFGVTPIHLAAWNNDITAIRKLLDVGARPSDVDITGGTALHWAAFGGSVEALRFLVESRVDIQAKMETGETALHMAAKGRCYNIIEPLIQLGVDVLARASFGGTVLQRIMHVSMDRWEDARKEAIAQLVRAEIEHQKPERLYEVPYHLDSISSPTLYLLATLSRPISTTAPSSSPPPFSNLLEVCPTNRSLAKLLGPPYSNLSILPRHQRSIRCILEFPFRGDMAHRA